MSQHVGTPSILTAPRSSSPDGSAGWQHRIVHAVQQVAAIRSAMRRRALDSAALRAMSHRDLCDIGIGAGEIDAVLDARIVSGHAAPG